MSAVPEARWDGRPVQIVRAGAVETVPYRHAVSLISRGIATWYTPEPAKPAKKAREKALSTPVSAPVLPERTAKAGERLPDLPESAYGPDAVPLESIVSNPAAGVEVDQAGYEPPLPDL